MAYDRRTLVGTVAALAAVLIVVVVWFMKSSVEIDIPGLRAERARSQISSLEEVLELYRIDNGAYPTTEQGLAALVNRPSVTPVPTRYPPGGYIKGDIPVDPWGYEYRYTQPGRHNTESFDLWSFGADNTSGGEGSSADITNWE